MLLGMEGLSYKVRLDRLELFSVDHMRLRGDLIEIYKIMRGIAKINSKDLFPKVEEFKTRGHIFKAPEAEDEVLLLQFVGGVVVTLEEAQVGHVTQGVKEGVKMVGDWKVLFVACRTHMLYKTVSESTLGLTNVEEATSGAADT
eukprot:g38518.t1